MDVVWEIYNDVKYVIKWSFVSDDWYVIEGKLNFVEGGVFNYCMEVKDELMGFNFMGIYDLIIYY